jgi:hypothetical protein
VLALLKKPVVRRLALGTAVVVAIGGATWIVAATQGTAPASSDGGPAAAPLWSVPGSGVPSARPSAVPSGSAGPSTTPSPNAKASATSKPAQSKRPSAPKSRGSFPSAGNTGVPSSKKLKAPSSSTVRVRKAGTVIDGVDMRTDISVEADNVTIKNSRFIVGGEWAIIQREGADGLTVQDSEIRGNGSDRLQHAIFNQGGDIRILRNDMSIASDPISTSQGLIQDNYLHDPIYFDGDHTDMIQSNSGPPSGRQLVIRHNTVINTLDQTAAIALFQDFGVQHSAVIENNLLAGGGYALYGGAGKMGTAHNIKVIDNVFSREVYKSSGAFGPVAYWDKNGSGNVWEGNVFDDGKAVNPD